MRSRRFVTTVVSAALAATVLVAMPGADRPAAAAAADDLEVSELDLTGVETAELATLPDPATVPTEEGAEPAAGARSAAEPTDEATPESAPAPGATPSPAGSPEPTAAPSPTTSPSPTVSPSPSPQPEPEVVPDVLTAELDTADFSVLGVTWDRTAGLAGVEIRYRVRIDGEWTDWSGLESSDIGPDSGTDDAESSGARDGTDPIVAVGADGVQIWAQAAAGTVTGLKAVLIDPGSDPANVGATVPGTGSTATTTSSTTGVFQSLGTADRSGTVRNAALAQPGIISRAGWGADESLRGCTPDYSRSTVTAAVHHTASSNGYTAAAVPGIIRGFYAYHTRPEAAGGRGWCDIGYNFLVDQYGRIFEGRAGGITSTVVGVHTGGFNSRTIGVAAIGDYSSYGPSASLAEGISQLIAWKFAVHRIQPNANVTMTSGGGASKYPAGTQVTFPAIYAHRDAALTSCPGLALYNVLGDIRNRVNQLAGATVASSPRWSLDAFSAGSGGITLRGWAFDPDSDAALPVRVSVDGAQSQLTANQSRPDVAAAFGVGPNHGFAGTVTAGNGRHLVCLTIGNVGAGQDVVIACDWLTVSNADPIGVLDSISTTVDSISVRGWALDPDTSNSIDVHLYVDGKIVRAFTANGSRPDIAAAYGRGDKHGFATTVPATGGTHQVCLYLINSPTGHNPRLDCRTVQVGSLPFGALDSATTTPDSVTVKGWAIDRDSSEPVLVHLYVDGKYTRQVTANQSRPDVDRAYGQGADRGFTVSATVPAGRHEVCLYLINRPDGPNPQLGCRTVTVTNALPIGAVDRATGSATGIRVSGWALDPDTRDPIPVHVYLDGKINRSVTADRNRPDVDRAYGRGAAHGFDVEIPAAEGRHEICLSPINTPVGTNPRLPCKTVTVANTPPIGAIDTARGISGAIQLQGWALDPDSTDSIDVHVYVDGAISTVATADRNRPDVDRVHGQGAAHGYDLRVPVAAGAHQVCVYAMNTPTGVNPRLGCHGVTVS